MCYFGNLCRMVRQRPFTVLFTSPPLVRFWLYAVKSAASPSYGAASMLVASSRKEGRPFRAAFFS